MTLEEIKQAAEREYGAVPYPITHKELFAQGAVFGAKLAMLNGWNDRHKIPIAAEPQPQCSTPLAVEKPWDATSWLNRGI